MKTIEVKIGKPSKFYNKGKRINLDTAFGMYQKGAKFAVNGKKINLNTFGVTTRTSRFDGDLEIVEYRNENLRLHREDGPAKIWLRDGIDGIDFIEWEEWYKDGLIHREDGPADIWYYEDGSIKSEGWFKDGWLHREDGPAYIYYDEDGSIDVEQWHWEGERGELSKEEHRRKREEERGFTPETRRKFAKQVRSLINRRKRKTATLGSLQNTLLGRRLNERTLRDLRNHVFTY